MTFNEDSTLGKIQELMKQGKDENEIAKILSIPDWKVKRHMNVINSVSQKEDNATSNRKIDVKNIHLQIDSIKGYHNDTHTGFTIFWSSDIGFGEYDIYQENDKEEKICGYSECMDCDEDKEFLSALLQELVKKIEIVG